MCGRRTKGCDAAGQFPRVSRAASRIQSRREDEDKRKAAVMGGAKAALRVYRGSSSIRLAGSPSSKDRRNTERVEKEDERTRKRRRGMRDQQEAPGSPLRRRKWRKKQETNGGRDREDGAGSGEKGKKTSEKRMKTHQRRNMTRKDKPKNEAIREDERGENKERTRQQSSQMERREGRKRGKVAAERCT